MTVYWETSRRPLFVKTVWTDGHRHPVLHEEDPLLHPQVKPTKRHKRRKPAAETPIPSENSDEELNISSVRLLLTNQRHEEIKPVLKEMRRVHSVDVVRQDIPKPSSNKLLHPHPITTFKLPIRGERQFTTREEKKDHHDDHHHYNILSERVMVWLDLASQNGECLKLNRYPNIKIKERINTCPCPKITPPSSPSSDETESQPEIQLPIQSISERVDDLDQICEPANVTFADGYKSDVRRQLHIFIPDLQRRDDCESNLTTSSL